MQDSNMLVGLELNALNISIIFSGILVATLILSIAFCFMYKIEFKSQEYGPVLFIYKYHVGSFQTIPKTMNQLTKQFNSKNGMSIVADKLKVDQQSLDHTDAGIFYDDPKTVEQSKLRSAIGIFIPLPKGCKKTNANTLRKTILNNLDLKDVYVRVLPKSNYMVTVFPLYFGMFSYMIGPMRVYPEAAKRELIEAPPMEVYGHSKLLGHSSDRCISYMFVQDNVEAFQIDIDMGRPSDCEEWTQTSK